MSTLVSIIIPVYNGTNFLASAIDSALEQSYSNVEIIVVNDGSNDNGATEMLALSYGSRIRYFSKPNGGVSSALNLGIREARGEWVSWLSHDDVYAANKIADQIYDLEHHGYTSKSRVVSLCGSYFIDARGERLPKKSSNNLTPGFYSSEQMLELMANGFDIGGCAMLIPKIAFNEVGFFDEDMRYVQDRDMWAKLFDAGYSLLDAPANKNVGTRIHGNQGQSTMRDCWQPESKVYTKRLALYVMKLDGGAALVRGMACRCYSVGDFAGGVSSLEALKEAEMPGVNALHREICFIRGHIYQALRTVYHHVCHGISR